MAVENAPARTDPSEARPVPGPVRVVEIRPAAAPARLRRRHAALALSFLLVVGVPLLLAAWYLAARAGDQYASRVGFAVRQEEPGSEIELLGGLTGLSMATSSDTDILYQFIRSQRLVELVDADLGLAEIFGWPRRDPVFALREDASMEDKLDYWGRMVRVFYDPGTGLIEVEARAFRPGDAQALTQAVFAHSSDVINALSDIAHADATRLAEAERDAAVARLKEARAALTRFRNETQIVDPTADIAGQMGLLASLEAQLAQDLIALDLLTATTGAGDPRIARAERRIAVIERRIAQERGKVGAGPGAGGAVYADLLGRFESLQVDVEFAQARYLAALAAHDSALAEARRQSRYLAAYLEPTRAETAIYPRRGMILAVMAALLLGLWAVGALVFYALRDRR